MQALIMGFGGTGAHVLTFLKELAVLRYGQKPEHLTFLLFDTIKDWKPGKSVETQMGVEETAQGFVSEASLDPLTEYFYLKDGRPDLKEYVYQLLSDDAQAALHPHLKNWLHATWLRQHVQEANLDIDMGASQQRQIGRFAIFQNHEMILQRLDNLIHRLGGRGGNVLLNVWLVGSAAGGTGAGCMLDAAYLTRLACSRRRANGKITGVVALPEVYTNIYGISLARAFSMFREIERFQAQGFNEHDYYLQGAEGAPLKVASHVQYDARSINVAQVQGRLFDTLFYLGRECLDDPSRRDFFSAVANSMDPYLDAGSYDQLLQKATNHAGAVSSLGASRMFLPKETLGEAMAWGQVRNFLVAAMAPNMKGNLAVDTYYGAPDDRRREARAGVDNLLPLFKELQSLTEKGEKQMKDYFEQSLQPKEIVTQWYQLGGAALAGLELTQAEKAQVVLSYVNPFYSLSEPDLTRIERTDILVKTFEENKKTKGPKESQEESRDRFAKELENTIKEYTAEPGGSRSFNSGQRLIKEKLTKLLTAQVDRMVLSALPANAAIGWDEHRPKDGTTFNRLYQVLQEASYDEGPLAKISTIVAEVANNLANEYNDKKQEGVNSLNALKNGRKGGIFSGTWVEELQRTARRDCQEYLEKFQMQALLRDMVALIETVRSRYRQWVKTLGQMRESLVMGGHDSLIYDVVARRLDLMETRLARLAENNSTLIALEKENGITLHGYRQELEELCANQGGHDLFDVVLQGARWLPAVAPEGHISLNLQVTLGDRTLTYTHDKLDDMVNALKEDFQAAINKRLSTIDIFDYLLYLVTVHKRSARELAERLSQESEVMLSVASGAPVDEVQMVYSQQNSTEKSGLAAEILHELKQINANVAVEPLAIHTDKNSLAVLKLKKPNTDAIANVNNCHSKYMSQYEAQFKGDLAHDQELQRSSVFHPFRAELESWHIERYWVHKGKMRNTVGEMIPPRMSRLLDDPYLAQAFVQCLASGAVERVNKKGWVWHGSPDGNNDVLLSDWAENPDADVVRAMVVFCLQQHEDRPRSLKNITAQSAERSAALMAQEKGQSLDQVVEDFANNNLDGWVRKHFDLTPDPRRNEAMREDEIKWLTRIIAFYCDPLVRPSIRLRK